MYYVFGGVIIIAGTMIALAGNTVGEVAKGVTKGFREGLKDGPEDNNKTPDSNDNKSE